MDMNTKTNTNSLSLPSSLKQEYKKRRKSVIIAYYFCLLMSGFGLHKVYLGDKSQALKFAGLYWVGLVVFASGFTLMDMGLFEVGASGFVMGMGALAVYGLWWVFDILTLFVQTKRKNELIMQQIIASHQ